jgi:ketosteroid isomerase-like protein
MNVFGHSYGAADVAAIFFGALFQRRLRQPDTAATQDLPDPGIHRGASTSNNTKGKAVVSNEAKNVAILKEAYQKWHETRGGSVDHFISIVDENISFGSLPRGAAPMQFAAQYDNREVLRGYFQELLDQWSMNYYEVKQFIAQDDMVVMQGVCSWTHKATGKTCETPKVDIWRFRDGKAVEFYELFDTAAAFAAATP